MDAPAFLHAAHDVREAMDRLRLVSWAVIGLGLAAIVLAWGRIIAWLRTPDAKQPGLVRWGQDDLGYYFELVRPGLAAWSIESEDGQLHPLVITPEGSLRAASFEAVPVAVTSSAGLRIALRDEEHPAGAGRD